MEHSTPSQINEAKTDILIETLKENIKNNKDIEMNAYIVRIPLLCQSVLNIHENLKVINEKLDNNFVTKDGQYYIVKTLVFTFAGLILIAVIGAFIKLIIIK